MKEIPNKQTPSLAKGLEDYAAIIRLALDSPPAKGFDLAVMRARNRVDEALNVGDDQIIKLEDADFETAKVALSECRWNFRHKDLIALYELFGL